MSKKIILKTIRIYQILFSPDHGIWRRKFSGCRFYPSCSEYAKQAVEKHGSTKGIVRALKRMKKCHPWNEGGYDPVN